MRAYGRGRGYQAVACWVSISVAETGTCALLVDGTAHCWGFGDDGQLANGMFVGSSSPLHVTNLDGASQIARTKLGGCARFGPAVSCLGELAIQGRGDTSDVTPAPVAGCE